MNKKTLILELLDRNLVLDRALVAEVREKLPSLSDQQVDQIGDILFKLDQEQTAALVSKLEIEPYFFRKLEGIILDTLSEQFDAEEAKTQAAADEQILADLATL